MRTGTKWDGEKRCSFLLFTLTDTRVALLFSFSILSTPSPFAIDDTMVRFFLTSFSESRCLLLHFITWIHVLYCYRFDQEPNYSHVFVSIKQQQNTYHVVDSTQDTKNHRKSIDKKLMLRGIDEDLGSVSFFDNNEKWPCTVQYLSSFVCTNTL